MNGALKSITLISVVMLAACDPGALPTVPPRQIDARADWFPSKSDDPWPLDVAIRSGKIDEVRTLLARGADPNARWGQSGDHFPLQEILDTGGWVMTDREATVRLLLDHGAHPSAKWCPFESRIEWDGSRGCESSMGFTPLIMAAILDDRAVVEMLLAAGADPSARDWGGGSALDYVGDQVGFELISRALFPDLTSRDRHALEWVSTSDGGPYVRGPWRQTPVSRAIADLLSGLVPPPPPPPPLAPGNRSRAWAFADRASTRQLNRLNSILRIGADSNERITLNGMDWPPLALTLHSRNYRAAAVLLRNGADVNARWCIALEYREYRTIQTRDMACSALNGRTGVMWSAQTGDQGAVELLLEFKADRSLKDWAGRTALDYATVPEVRKLLAPER